MKSKKAGQDQFSVALDDGGILARRKTNILPDGCYLFQDKLQVAGVLNAKVITCTAWLLELYRLSSGEMSFRSARLHLAPKTKVFGAFYPPFTISAPCFQDVEGYLIGVAGTQHLPPEFTKAPAFFETSFAGVPGGFKEVLQILRTAINLQPVAAYPNPSLLSLKARRLIDESYLDYPSIARVAKRLGVTPAHLSRQFKADFEMSPSGYLHQLRLADAPLRLARGEDIVNVSENVGYNDLSRFYKQFRKRNSSSPAACRDILKPRPVG
jgi:AraC-like DNA-binding protein